MCIYIICCFFFSSSIFNQRNVKKMPKCQKRRMCEWWVYFPENFFHRILFFRDNKRIRILPARVVVLVRTYARTGILALLLYRRTYEITKKK